MLYSNMLLFYKQAVSSVPSTLTLSPPLDLNMVRLVLVLVFAIGSSGVSTTSLLHSLGLVEHNLF